MAVGYGMETPSVIPENIRLQAERSRRVWLAGEAESKDLAVHGALPLQRKMGL